MKFLHTKIELEEMGAKRVRRRYTYTAEKKGIDFHISDVHFFYLIKRSCYYCNKEPSNVLYFETYMGSHDYIYNGLDRKNNTKGYIPNNVVPCCKECNYLKSDMDYLHFLRKIKNIYENLQLQQFKDLQ